MKNAMDPVDEVPPQKKGAGRTRGGNLAPGDNLNDNIARFQTGGLGFPEAEVLMPTIDAVAESGGDGGKRFADLVGSDLAFPQDYTPARRGKIGHVFGGVSAVRGPGEQKAGKAGRVDDDVCARLMRNRFIVLRPDHHADR